MITKAREIELLTAALSAAKSGDDEILDRCYVELMDDDIDSIAEIVAYLRAQAKMRAQENDEAGILLKYAYRIERDVDELENPRPFAGLDACETE